MPEVIDWGDKFRQLGSDVSNAITEPVKMRLQMAVAKRELDKENYAQGKQAIAGEEVGKKYGATGKAFYEAGDFDSFVKMRQLDIEAAKARATGSGDGKDSANKYMEKFMLAHQMTEQLQKQQEAAQKAVDDARQSGDTAALSSAMDQFTAVHDASIKASEQIKILIGSVTPEGRVATSGALMEDLDKTLSGFDSAKIDAIEQTVRGQVGESKSLNSSILTSLDNTKNAYDLKIDLSGVPSDASLKKYLAAAFAKGDISSDNVQIIQNATDSKSLAKIANDDSIPMALRTAAGAKFMRLTTFEAVYPDGSQKLKAASDAEVANLAFSKDIDKTVSKAAQEELGSRGILDMSPRKLGGPYKRSYEQDRIDDAMKKLEDRGAFGNSKEKKSVVKK